MALKVEVSGQQQLLRLAKAFREAGNQQLGQQLDRGLRSAGNTVGDEVRGHTDVYMPRGYEETFRRHLLIKVQVRLANGRRVTIIGSAKGKHRARHVMQMEEGLLRHPVHGRTRRVRRHFVYLATSIPNPWFTQRIRRGWFSEPAHRAIPRAIKQIDDAVARVAKQIEAT